MKWFWKLILIILFFEIICAIMIYTKEQEIKIQKTLYENSSP